MAAPTVDVCVQSVNETSNSNVHRLQPINPEKLKVAELRDWMKTHNVPFHHSWNKLQLVQKVKDAIANGVQPVVPNRGTKASSKVSYPAAGTGWGKSLTNVKVTIKMVDLYIAQHNTSAFQRQDLSAPSVKAKAFKFAVEGYCTNILTHHAGNTIFCSCRCFHSFRRNERPHVVKCAVRNGQIVPGTCTCSAGEGGHCNHVLALLYSFCTFTDNKLTTVPDDITCTSMLQKWHKPRGKTINPEPIDMIVVKKIRMQDGSVATKQTKGIQSTLYKAARVPLLHDPQLVHQAVQRLQNINPRIPAAYMLKPSKESTVHTSTVFGPVEKGSLLSYQYRLQNPVIFPTVCKIPLHHGPLPKPIAYPRFPLHTVTPFSSSSVQGPDDIDNEHYHDFLHNLILTDMEASSLERDTRKQSESALWKSARQHRLTASKFGKVKQAMNKKGVKSKDKLIKDKLHPQPPSHFVQQMFDHGLRMEPIIANRYAAYMQSIGHPVVVSDSGVVVNENNLWLAATPDKKVVDMSENMPFGILEMKAPAHAKYKHVTPLEACNSPTFYQENVNGFPQLKHTHESGYYEQVQGQMALTGAKWCDFVVCTEKGMSIERIKYDHDFWLETVKPLEDFYFQYFIPAIIKIDQ